MLKFINHQLGDDATQNELEQQLSHLIQQRIPANLAAFKKYSPQLLQLAQNHKQPVHSVFCTKEGQLNLVNINNGRVIYKVKPEQEVQHEVEQFLADAPLIHLTHVNDMYSSEPLPSQVDVLMMFGHGLGYQLRSLLSGARIRYLVIYEPELDNFLCSIQAIDWLEIFQLAAVMGTQLSFQFGNAGTTIAEDVSELLELEPGLDKIYLYRHLCHPVSDEVILFMQENNGNIDGLQRKGRQFQGFDNSVNYIFERPKNVLGHEVGNPSASEIDQDVFDRNMSVFARLYPEVHATFSNYKPKNWHLSKDPEGFYNLYHLKRKVFFYDDPVNDSVKMVDKYLEEPFKDDVIVGQASIDKFKSFIHFKYIDKLQDIFLNLKSEKKALPEKVDSLIVFGVALGMHIQHLCDRCDIKNLYVCEPNLDFFYASLFITDWASLLTLADKQDKRIYLNIGGDGSEYFNDFMGQFYQVGAYAIANTYMMPGYYTPQLFKAIQSLKRQLKVVLAMGEFYDHARYGIAHSYLSLQNGHCFMRANVRCAAKHPALDVPVFLIGNGPSLDTSAEFIKDYREQIIVISCGTAIRSLHKLGITPDFHAEVEQNRATYNWITQVNDFTYLKKIKLISVNGVHPDTASLFEQTFLAFKDGEASTQVFRGGLDKLGVHVASLSYAYPTVSNMALNYILKMGFNTVYLLGVDLGYADIKQHHSKHSAYYADDGKEVYDYLKFHGEGFPVKGNFRSFVFTKPEFDVSRQLIEKAIAALDDGIHIYNCSDGAFIEGAMPLLPSNILLPAENIAPQALLNDYLQKAYFYPPLEKEAKEIFEHFNMDDLGTDIENWLALIPDDGIDSALGAKQVIEKQWEFLRGCAANNFSLTFYLFYGSSTYFLSVLTKVLPEQESDQVAIDRFNFILKVWKEYLADALHDFTSQPIKADRVQVDYLPQVQG